MSRLDYIDRQKGDLLDKDSKHQEPVWRDSSNRELQRGEEEVHRSQIVQASPHRCCQGINICPREAAWGLCCRRDTGARQGKRAAPTNTRSAPTLPQESN